MNRQEQQSLRFDRYAGVHSYDNITGPGDGRPTALQIIEDEKLHGQLSDKVILVTGGSSGIGVETVRALAQTSAKVILGVRNIKKGQQVINDILSKDKNVKEDQLELLEMDLDSFESVRDAAKDYLAKHDKLNILINNAGLAGVSKGKTADGFETHFGVNHLAHFLLFQLLSAVLISSSTRDFKSRVVVVSSVVHRATPVLLNDPNFETTPYHSSYAYANSKTANIWFANELERRYAAQGVHAISLHPGGIETGLQSHHDPDHHKMVADVVAQFPHVLTTYKSVEQGAATTVLAAVGKTFEGVGGIYLDDYQVAPPHDPEKDLVYAPGYAKWAFDEEREKKLWEITTQMVG